MEKWMSEEESPLTPEGGLECQDEVQEPQGRKEVNHEEDIQGQKVELDVGEEILPISKG